MSDKILDVSTVLTDYSRTSVSTQELEIVRNVIIRSGSTQEDINEDLLAVAEEVVFPFAVLGLLDLMAVAQIRNRDVALKAFENDLKLLFIGPFTVFMNERPSLSGELNSTLFWSSLNGGSIEQERNSSRNE